MFHHQSLLGLSIIFLTCASPTLGVAAELSTAASDPTSPSSASTPVSSPTPQHRALSATPKADSSLVQAIGRSPSVYNNITVPTSQASSAVIAGSTDHAHIPISPPKAEAFVEDKYPIATPTAASHVQKSQESTYLGWSGGASEDFTSQPESVEAHTVNSDKPASTHISGTILGAASALATIPCRSSRPSDATLRSSSFSEARFTQYWNPELGPLFASARPIPSPSSAAPAVPVHDIFTSPPHPQGPSSPTAFPAVSVVQYKSTAIVHHALTASSYSSSMASDPSSMSPLTGLASSSPVPFLPIPSLVTTHGLAVPTTHDLSNPNPALATEASESAKKTAILAGMLILATFTAIGGGILCFRCGFLSCCNGEARKVNSIDRIVEEGLNHTPKYARGCNGRKSSEKSGESGEESGEKLGEKSGEKPDTSIVPGSPPVVLLEDTVNTLNRHPHAHTLSCSTCPPNSLSGVRGGVTGGATRNSADKPDWSPENNQHPDLAQPHTGPGECVTTILSSTAFTNDQSDGSLNSVASGSAHSSEMRVSLVSSGTVMSAGRSSGASVGPHSVSAESYMSCESASKYSITSTLDRERIGSVGVSVAEVQDGDARTSIEAVLTAAGVRRDSVVPVPASPNWSDASASTAGTSVLLLTPEQPDYASLADAALRSGSPTPLEAVVRPRLVGATIIIGEGVNSTSVGPDIESEWDVAAAYGAPSSARASRTSSMRASKASSVALTIADPPRIPSLVIRESEAGGGGSDEEKLGKAQRTKKSLLERKPTGVGLMNLKTVTFGAKKLMVLRG